MKFYTLNILSCSCPLMLYLTDSSMTGRPLINQHTAEYMHVCGDLCSLHVECCSPFRAVLSAVLRFSPPEVFTDSPGFTCLVISAMCSSFLCLYHSVNAYTSQLQRVETGGEVYAAFIKSATYQGWPIT